jgi:hypothetical protein
MKKQRKHSTPEEKVSILKRHLVEGVPISDLSLSRSRFSLSSLRAKPPQSNTL